MRISEGGPRKRVLIRRGPLYQPKDGVWRCNPIAYLTHEDIWAYIFSNKLPYNKRIYDAQTHGLTRESIRNTGWLSTDGAHDGRVAWLREHFPEQYRMLVDEFPQVTVFT